ncbi:MAG: hypothetical protein KGL42_14020 [Betaproteobacteria bacterium]|nr:hypothetical protein [Betaproteobacteria bacterium]
MTRPGHEAQAPPGRHCPARYRYAARAFDCAPCFEVDTVYVVGGLYGNVEALQAVLAMRQAESRHGCPVTLMFNGDFHWFDVDAESFTRINDVVLEHAAICGNVELELVTPSDGAGCGCAYPDDVPNAVVLRSNRIMRRLNAQAANAPESLQRLAALPMHATIGLAGRRIGIVHGDAHSLAGWDFAIESLELSAAQPQADGRLDQLRATFRQAKVNAFCSSHTCLPAAFALDVDGQRRLIINNGAAGMPNFRDTSFGVLTRVSIRADVPPDSLYGMNLGGLRFDALPIHFDERAWQRRFLRNWPTGSDAHASYFARIMHGPDFELTQAVIGGGVRQATLLPQPSRD